MDTGAVSTILPGALAGAVGVSPRTGSSSQVLIGGGAVRAWEAGEVVLRVQGSERDSTGRERTLDVPSRALVVWSPSFLDLALLGLRGFLDGVDELCVRAREQVFEIARG